MDRCYDCGRLVDTDDDPSCYVEIGNMRRHNKTVCMCEACREREENSERMAFEDYTADQKVKE